MSEQESMNINSEGFYELKNHASFEAWFFILRI